VIDTSANVVISKANEVFLRVKADPHIEYELRDHFTFQVESAKFMPQYRNRNWNGEILKSLLLHQKAKELLFLMETQ